MTGTQETTTEEPASLIGAPTTRTRAKRAGAKRAGARRTGARRAGARRTGAGRAIATGAVLMCAAGIATTLANPALAAPKPVTLQALGKPVISANCQGGSYRVATAASPMTTISGRKWTSGIALTGTNCNTAFTWKLTSGYTSLNATFELDGADSGPLKVEFRSGNAPVKFKVNGKLVSQLKVGPQGPVRVGASLKGLRQLSIVLPNAGSDAGILDVTSSQLS
jgi:hypothetical protein